VSIDTRVVRLITRLNIGGPARQALLLTRALLPTYRTTLVAGTPTAAEGELDDPRVAVERVRLVRQPAPTDDVRALAQIRRVLRRDRPALVHTHMAKAGSLGRIATVGLEQPPVTVHTFHGHVLEGYFRPAVQRAFLEVERRLARRTTALVAVSAEIRDQLLDLGIGRPEQYSVVRLGLDLDAHFAVTGRSGALRERLGIGDDIPLAGIVGRLVAIKDVETLLRAWCDVRDAHLAVIGDGDLRAELESLAASLDLTDRVHFTGWMLDVPAVMADLDLAVLSSRNEGTPVALIEAAACGRPAVATSVGGVPSVVEDGVSGVLVPAGDRRALAGAVTELLGDDTARAAMGAAARERARAFTSDRLVQDIRRLYSSLLD
jgi:glycosyltransferase involved in cell wall biosynthesis